MKRIASVLVGLVSRIPARVQAKLLAAFLTIAALLVMVGAVGLQVLREVNGRTGQLIKLQRKIEAYRQVQHDTTSQLYSVASALAPSDERTLTARFARSTSSATTLIGWSLSPRTRSSCSDQFRQDYDRFTDDRHTGGGINPRRPRRRGAADAGGNRPRRWPTASSG